MKTIIRYFRKKTGLYYHIVKSAKIGDLVILEDHMYQYDYFGVLTFRNDELVIDMGNKYFIITNEIKENINAGSVDRFYFKGIRI